MLQQLPHGEVKRKKEILDAFRCRSEKPLIPLVSWRDNR